MSYLLLNPIPQKRLRYNERVTTDCIGAVQNICDRLQKKAGKIWKDLAR